MAPVTVSPSTEVTFRALTLTALMLASPTVTVPVKTPSSAEVMTASFPRVRELRVTWAPAPMAMVVQNSAALKVMSPSATVPLMVIFSSMVGTTSAEVAWRRW